MATSSKTVCTIILLSFVSIKINASYTYMENADVISILDDLRYRDRATLEVKWKAEGNSVKAAVTNILSRSSVNEKLGNGYTQLICCSAGEKGGQLLAGLVKLLADGTLVKLPSKVIIVYTLDYASGDKAESYKVFNKLLEELTVLCQKPQREVELKVNLFNPTLISEHDYADLGKIKMELYQSGIQRKTIHKMNKASPHEELVEHELRDIIEDKNVKIVWIGIHWRAPASVENQLYMAYPRAFVRIMSGDLKPYKLKFFTITYDIPSGMGEAGNWECGVGYKVSFMLQTGWNKACVNSDVAELQGSVTYVLDIVINGYRFVRKALEHIQTTQAKQARISAATKDLVNDLETCSSRPVNRDGGYFVRAYTNE